MSNFENHKKEISDIEAEIVKRMSALGIDWRDEHDMTRLAADFHGKKASYRTFENREEQTKNDLLGLVILMFATMAEAASEEKEVHAGPAWKSLAKHLYAKAEEQ